MNKILTLEQVSAYYEHQKVLTAIDLTIHEHDFIGIIGPNGGGKTTLIRILLGILKPTQGTLTYYQDGLPAPNLNIGYLPQELRVDMSFPISVEEVILSGLTERNKRISFQRGMRERVDACIELLDLKSIQKKPIGTLSGGQLQRTLLGRAIISNPQLLVLDEPNTYMDQQREQELYALLGRLNKTMAILMVSHNLNVVSEHVKSIIHIDHSLSII